MGSTDRVRYYRERGGVQKDRKTERKQKRQIDEETEAKSQREKTVHRKKDTNSETEKKDTQRERKREIDTETKTLHTYFSGIIAFFVFACILFIESFIHE